VRPWLLAARPRTLLASISPVLVGTGSAVGAGTFRADAFVVTLATALLLNIAVNFANDASDHARGADTAHRIGPPRAVANGLLTARQVWAATAVVAALAVAGGIYLAAISGWLIIVIGVAALVAAFGYTGGPWPYGYHGLGEVSVFLFFGVAAVTGSRYAHDATIAVDALSLSVPVGLLAAAILVANNVRDIETDRAAGKRTLAVVLGRDRARTLFTGLVVVAFLSTAGFAAAGLIPSWTWLSLAAAPLAAHPIAVVGTEIAGPPLIAALVATARLHLVVGALLALGAALG
jgi:1,4-dihydroxy-2-naphthoate polyprenyltransferase